MKKLLSAFGFLVALFCAPLVHAAPCGGYPYQLANGTLADATQVMSDFNQVMNCLLNNAAASGANTDITSLTGLTTPLGIAYGGTGNTTGAPSGPAGGVLSGTYPNPGFANCGNLTVIINITGGSAAPSCTAISSFSTKLTPFVGDTGSGGTVGAVPAPPAGSGNGGQVLCATGSWCAVAASTPGMIVMYGAAGAPTGWLVCNGAAVSRTTYSALFAVVGTSFGSGDGSTTFNVPNFQGYFPRGFNGSGSGPDSGRTFGSSQTDQMQGHVHRNGIGQTNGSGTMMTYTTTATDVPGNGLSTAHADANVAQSQGTTSVAITDGTNGTPRVGAETRPSNVAVNFIIKTAFHPANDNNPARLLRVS